MESSNLVFICFSAFIAVFLLLSLLAIVMRVIIGIFPAKESETNAAIIAAISTTMQAIFPGTKITKIAEEK